MVNIPKTTLKSVVQIPGNLHSVADFGLEIGRIVLSHRIGFTLRPMFSFRSESKTGAKSNAFNSFPILPTGTLFSGRHRCSADSIRLSNPHHKDRFSHCSRNSHLATISMAFIELWKNIVSGVRISTYWQHDGKGHDNALSATLTGHTVLFHSTRNKKVLEFP